MKIGGLKKCSLIDYPEKISAIIFTQGCNFRCAYCHNSQLVHNACDSLVEESHVLDFLRSRKDKLDGVVISGGEPCLQSDITNFAGKIKEMGFSLKLDTNGTLPCVLEELLRQNLIDYIAMDIKAPANKYNEIVCKDTPQENILKSIDIIKNSGLMHEFRTTVVKSQLLIEDFEEIGKMIEGAKEYYLQKFIPTNTLNKFFKSQQTYDDKDFSMIINIMKKYVTNVHLR